MSNITFDYPFWFILICFALGAIYAIILYFRDKTFKNAVEHSKQLIWGLGILRFLLVSFIAFLLLSPLLKTISTEEEKPIIVMMQDNSASVGMAMSEEDSTAYFQNFNTLIADLRKDYQVDVYSFGEELNREPEFNFTNKATDIAAALDEVNNIYVNQNVGAVILASDGIYNQGNNPLYLQNKLNAPIHAVALGDTIPKKDIKVSKVAHNRIAYLGDKFTVQADLEALNYAGENSTLTVSKIGRNQNSTLVQERILFDKKDYESTEEIILNADQIGLQHYRISLSPLSGEATEENNFRDFFIEVLDARQKVLILANSPHPDISAMKQALEQNKNYDLEVAFASEFNKNIDQYNLVVLHQLPSAQFPVTSILNQIKDNNVPVFYVVGQQTSLPLFNQVQKVVTISNHRNNFNEVQPVLNKDFALFKLPENLPNLLERFPPVIAPYGNYSTNTGAGILLQQKIGAVATGYPLMVFDQTGNSRTGVITGEGIWRWRLYNYLLSKNHEVFDELFSKVVQYLAVKADKRRFRITLPKNIFNENEQVVFDAELYNESYELINTPEVSVNIINDEGKEFPFTFNKTANAYALNVGFMPVGSYSFEASTVFNGKKYTYQGQFSVSPIKLEALQTTADHQLLYQLSNQTGGNLYFASGMDELGEDIRSAASIKPVLHDTQRTRSIINLKWIFFILLGLLAFEWFIRKYNGAY